MRSTLALTALFAAVLTLALTSPARVAQAQKPPANATSADVVPSETSGSVDVLHTMMLRKWRKGRILRVDAVLEMEDLSGNVVALLNYVRVNGFRMVEVEYNDAHVCSGTQDCTGNASAWLDLDDAYDDGAAHEFFISYEAGRPGGSLEAARVHYERALELSGGERASVFLALAESVSVAEQDVAEFRALLNQARAIDPDETPDSRLLNIVAQERADWLEGQIPELFLVMQ